MEQAYAKIARASLGAAGGKALYPDATFTLRLAFGIVSGYAGLPYTTDFASLYAKTDAHQGQPPFCCRNVRVVARRSTSKPPSISCARPTWSENWVVR